MSTLNIKYLTILKSMVVEPDGYYLMSQAEKEARDEGRMPPPDAQGELLKELPLAEGMKKLKQIIREDGPDRDHLPEALEAFRTRKAAEGGGEPRDYNPGYSVEEMQRRYDYSGQCREALLGCYERRIQQYLRWNEVAGQVLGMDADGKTPRKTNTHRWMERLIRMDDTAESRRHNEKLVTLAAMVNGDIDQEQFREKRYQAHLAETNSQEEARRLAQEECDKGAADALLELLAERIEETKNKLPQINAAIDSIVKGTAENLEQAYQLVEDDGIYLMMNGTDCLSDLTTGTQRPLKNYKTQPDAELKRAKEWEAIGCVVSTSQELVEDIAAPHYAYLDPLELRKANIRMVEHEWGEAIGEHMDAYSTIMLKLETYAMGPTLAQYGFVESPNQYERNDFMVYRQNGQSLIFEVEDVSWQDGRLQMQVNQQVPGRLVDKNLEQELKGFLDTYDQVEEGELSLFAALGEGLKSLEGKKLGDDPEREQLQDFTEKFQRLKRAAEVYLASEAEKKKQQAKQPGEAKKPEFVVAEEKKRARLARNLKSFAEKKLKQLVDVKGHQGLMLQAEIARDNARQDGIRTQWAMFDVQFNAAFQAENRINEGPGDYARPIMAGNRIDEYINKKWEEYVTEEQAQGQGKDIEDFEATNDQVCKRVLAGHVVKALVLNEEQLFASDEDQRIMQEYIVDGKLDKLVHMVWKSESFCDQIRCLDLSNREDAQAQIDAGLPRQVAKDIMKNFLENQRENAKQNPLAKGEPKPALENEPKNKRPVIKS